MLKIFRLKFEGESLFNDGIGVVVFSAIFILSEMEVAPEQSSIGVEIGRLFLEEAVGGMLYGAILGFLGYTCIKSVDDNPQLAVMISLAIAMGGYSIASLIHVSGPLAMVVSGIIIGNKINIASNQGATRKLLNDIWESLDDVFNGVLFVLIGLSIHLLKFEMNFLLLGFLAILAVTIARFCICAIALFATKTHRKKTFKNRCCFNMGCFARGYFHRPGLNYYRQSIIGCYSLYNL